MKYIEPKIKVSKFYQIINTDGTPETMDAVASAEYTQATKSLETTFITAAQMAEKVLVYKWN